MNLRHFILDRKTQVWAMFFVAGCLTGTIVMLFIQPPPKWAEKRAVNELRKIAASLEGEPTCRRIRSKEDPGRFCRATSIRYDVRSTPSLLSPLESDIAWMSEEIEGTTAKTGTTHFWEARLYYRDGHWVFAGVKAEHPNLFEHSARREELEEDWRSLLTSLLQ